MSARCSAPSPTTAPSSSLGAKALRRAEDKLKSLEAETRYKPEDKQFLIERWRELKIATESAIRELESARQRLRRLLRKLQTSEDFIDELCRSASTSARSTSSTSSPTAFATPPTSSRSFSATIKPPGA